MERYFLNLEPLTLNLTQISDDVTISPGVTRGSQEYGLFGLPHMGRFWTFSNILSLTRLIIAVPVVYLVLKREPGEPASMTLLTLVAIGIATDWFDGRIARWSRTVSDWGKFLDPLADKIAAGLVVLALAFTGAFPWWFVILMITRDGLTGLGWSYLSRKTGRFLQSRLSGKAATFAVAVTILAALLVADPEIMEVCVWATTTLLVYSFVDYLVHFVFVLRHRKDTDATGRSGPPPVSVHTN